MIYGSTDRYLLECWCICKAKHFFLWLFSLRRRCEHVHAWSQPPLRLSPFSPIKQRHSNQRLDTRDNIQMNCVTGSGFRRPIRIGLPVLAWSSTGGVMDATWNNKPASQGSWGSPADRWWIIIFKHHTGCHFWPIIQQRLLSHRSVSKCRLYALVGDHIHY